MASGMGFRKGVKSFIFKWLVTWCKKFDSSELQLHVLHICSFELFICNETKKFHLKGQAHEIFAWNLVFSTSMKCSKKNSIVLLVKSL